MINMLRVAFHIKINTSLKYYLFCFAKSFSVDRPRKFELLSLYASKGSHTACVTTSESNFVGRSTESIQQSKIKGPLQTCGECIKPRINSNTCTLVLGQCNCHIDTSQTKFQPHSDWK